MTNEEAIYELERMKTWSKDLSDDEIEAIAIALKALNQKPILDKIRSEIEKVVWEDILPIFDEKYQVIDEIRTPLLDAEDVFEIIDKYRAESEDKEEKR